MKDAREKSPTAVIAVLLSSVLACGIGIRRDLSEIPPGQIGFDDMCGLQEYFDTLEVKAAAPPRLVSSVELESDSKKTVRGGKALIAFETDFQLNHLRRVLDANWKRLPPELAAAKRIDLEVYWAEKAGVKRVVTERDFEIMIDRQQYFVPYHVCVSELLYGEPLYRQRREMWGLPLPKRPVPDGGASQDVKPAIWTDAATSDTRTGH